VQGLHLKCEICRPASQVESKPRPVVHESPQLAQNMFDSSERMTELRKTTGALGGYPTRTQARHGGFVTQAGAIAVRGTDPGRNEHYQHAEKTFREELRRI